MNDSISQQLAHWETVYREKAAEAVSWFQREPAISLSLIHASGVGHDAPIIDVGGGASVLVDHLLELDFGNVTVLDIASNALAIAKKRLGPESRRVRWLVGDVTQFEADKPYALWHDRAVFHFLTNAAQQQAYRNVLRKSLSAQAQVVMGTFALDGPIKCSGLEVVQYDATRLCAVLGPEFILEEERRHAHQTPSGATQNFAWFRLRYVPAAL